jgi:WhiB family transcriptional regulator, redox-sensing transcriptional regulator
MASWLDRAACKGKPIEIFFWNEGTTRYGNGAEAKAICAECPVVHECLTDALKIHHRDQYGVFGGKTAKERQRILETRLLRRNT